LAIITLLSISLFFCSQQQAIDNCRDIDCWERNLNNNRPAGVTTAELNELFDYVREVRNNNNPNRCD